MWIIYIKLEQGKSFRNTHDHFVLLFDGGGGKMMDVVVVFNFY